MNEKHSVLLKEDKCEGCTNCVKNCPTKAIRVHQGKAAIKEELCIDCAECIRTCEYHAKYTETNSLQDINNYDYSVVLVPPSFYGQFDDGIDPSRIVRALKELGFDQVRDVARAAEALSRKTVEFLSSNKGPYISSSCPVVVRLIKLLYPELLEYLIPFKSPVQLMAQRVRKELKAENQHDPEKTGVFFITPCPAKLTTVKSPLGVEESNLDGAIAVDRVYSDLLKEIKSDNKQALPVDYDSPYLGISWGQSGGEEDILNFNCQYETLSISGIHNVKAVLEELTRDNISGVKYYELVACPQGCVGGVLNVNNPFQAKYNLQKLVRGEKSFRKQDITSFEFEITSPFQADEVGRLDEDIEKAMEKLTQLEEEINILPGLDCAACGAPDCKTLAEDIVNGLADRTDCIFMLRKEVGNLADRISNLTHELPPVMSEEKQREEGDSDECK